MKDTESCVSYCGRLSGFFNLFFAIESGIRQGCLIFPLAFVLTVGPLANKIKNCKDIKAIRNWSAVNDINMAAVVKIAVYADDITFLPKEEEILNALSIVIFSFFLSFFFLEYLVWKLKKQSQKPCGLVVKKKCRNLLKNKSLLWNNNPALFNTLY